MHQNPFPGYPFPTSPGDQTLPSISGASPQTEPGIFCFKPIRIRPGETRTLEVQVQQSCRPILFFVGGSVNRELLVRDLTIGRNSYMLSGGAMTLGSLLEQQLQLRFVTLAPGMTVTLVIENDSAQITRRFVGGFRAYTLSPLRMSL